MFDKRMDTMRRLTCLFCVFVTVLVFVEGETGKKLDCHDNEGNVVPDGTEFIPDKKDPCQTCHCDAGFAIMCTSVSCSPPACRSHAVEGKCCEFVCIDKQPGETHLNGGNSTGGTRSKDLGDGGITNLGLRLVASTITSFLVLALLLFMIHKLRQRRLMLAVRRLNSSRRRLEEMDHDHYLPDSPPLGMTVPPYQDPPPPYSPPKPSHTISHGEPPPPYDAIDNNNFRNALDHLDLPPEYDSRSCINSTTISSASATGDVPSRHDLAASTISTNSACTVANSQSQADTHCSYTSHNLGSESSIEDTRVKEVFSTSCGCERQGNSSVLSNTTGENSIRSPPGESSRNVPRTGSTNEIAESSRRIPQSWVSVFGPRCIKKSGSVEIVRQSISPRNSYYMEGVDAMSQSLDPAVLNRILYGVRDEGSDANNSSNAGKSSFMNGHNSSMGQTQLCNSSMSSRNTNCADSGQNNESSRSVGDHSQRETTTASDRRRQFRLSSLLHSPIESTESPVSSPISPTDYLSQNADIRSNSITSDLSWFSVCSETGEPRKSKNRPSTNVIQNDSQYPDMPNLSRYMRSEIECSKALSMLKSACGTDRNSTGNLTRDRRLSSKENVSIRASVGSVGDLEKSFDSLDPVSPILSNSQDLIPNVPRSTDQRPTSHSYSHDPLTDGISSERAETVVCDRKQNQSLAGQSCTCSCKTCQPSSSANSGPWERSRTDHPSQGNTSTKSNRHHSPQSPNNSSVKDWKKRGQDESSCDRNKKTLRSSTASGAGKSPVNSKPINLKSSLSASAMGMRINSCISSSEKVPSRRSYPHLTSPAEASPGNGPPVFPSGDYICPSGAHTLPTRPQTNGKVSTPHREPRSKWPTETQGYNRHKNNLHACSAPLCSDV